MWIIRMMTLLYNYCWLEQPLKFATENSEDYSDYPFPIVSKILMSYSTTMFDFIGAKSMLQYHHNQKSTILKFISFNCPWIKTPLTESGEMDSRRTNDIKIALKSWGWIFSNKNCRNKNGDIQVDIECLAEEFMKQLERKKAKKPIIGGRQGQKGKALFGFY